MVPRVHIIDEMGVGGAITELKSDRYSGIEPEENQCARH
jgi:hypothetical protein